MRSAFALAAFAAGAIAVPFVENKRALDYDYEVAYVTKVVTVTAYGPEPTQAPKPPHYPHGHKSSTKVTSAPVTTSEAAPVYQAPAYEAPAYEAPAYEAPAPVYSAPPASTSAPSAGSPPTDYNSAVLYSHNLHRANHSAPDLVWSDELYDCALELAQKCKYEHDVTPGGGGYGQNIAAGVSADNVTAIISDMFYNGEEPLYAPYYGREPDMGNFEGWGHFSQMVWVDTTHVACVTYNCEANGLEGTGGGVSPWFTVCNYKSPGNYAGQYAANVLAPKGYPTADWSASSY